MRTGPLLFLPFAIIVFASCGGDPVSSPNTDPDPVFEPVVIEGTVSGPRDPAGLQILGAFGAGVVAADGTFSLNVLTGGGHVAVVVDDEQKVVYLGLLDPHNTTVDATSTARVILFHAIGGPLLMGDMRTDVFGDPIFEADAATLAQVITDSYSAGGMNLEDIGGDVEAAFATLVLLGDETKRRTLGDKTLVNPPRGISGIDLDTTVDRQLTLRNNYRRRALAWVDLVEGVDADGATVEFNRQVAEVDISPTVAFTSVIGTLIDAIYGNYMWAPVASQPIPLPLQPVDGKETTYKVTVLGMGSSLGDYGSLSPARQDRFTMLALRTIFADFVTPIVLNIALPSQSDRIDDFLQWYGGSAVLGDFIGIVAQTVPGIAEKALAGDLDGAVWDAINAVGGGGTMNAVAMQNWTDAILEHYDLATASDFSTAASAFLNAMTYVNILGTVLDSARQVSDIADSHLADQWDLTVMSARLAMDPYQMTMQRGNNEAFRVIVQNAGDRAFEYHWSCSVGELRDGIHQGQAFETSSATVTYHSLEAGDDAVAVEVFEIQGMNRLRLGTVSAAINVTGASPMLVPRRDSLREGDRGTFTVRMQAGYESDEPLFYRWTGGDQHGSHEGSGIIGTYDHVTYLAESEGVDNLVCEVFIGVNGRMESIGTTEAEIRVEQEPTIIAGTYRTQVWHTEEGRYGAYADVVWEAFPEATGYRLYGFGGNDPYYYHEGPIVITVIAGNVHHDHVDEMPAGEIWQTLSGNWGPADGEADAITYMEGRFGSGWTWEVEVYR